MEVEEVMSQKNSSINFSLRLIPLFAFGLEINLAREM